MHLQTGLPHKLGLALVLVASGATLASPREAHAFCGFYVAGADSQLYNNATMVVLMRDGTRTVLSMANNYQGPPKDFAMVVPVPVVLQEGDVKVLPAEIFDRVDKLAAPRLVEYWEVDPCNVAYFDDSATDGEMLTPQGANLSARKARNGVTIEAEFTVGEYQVVILSAKDSTGLDKWLRREKYNIPAGARPLLDPYVQAGSKFFVAKVDATKVEFDAQGMATLSPLRFHYDSQEFSLPVRLGLINAQGPQDLLVHVLARGVRYELANYDNIAIPTNLDVKNEVRDRFGQFYAALFDHALAKHPKAVVTEYSWSAGSCDPCPEPPLTLAELVTLGADVLPSHERVLRGGLVPSEVVESIPSEFVLTRLHARYDASSLGEDLVFQAAPAIVGGREFFSRRPAADGRQQDGQLERGAIEEPNGHNNFQARYSIRHEWTGPIDCPDPQRGVWGEPWPGVVAEGTSGQPEVARELASVQRGAALAEFVTESAAAQIEADIGPLPTGPIDPPRPNRDTSLGDTAADGSENGGCAHCRAGEAQHTAGALMTLGFAMLALLGVRRRRRQP